MTGPLLTKSLPAHCCRSPASEGTSASVRPELPAVTPITSVARVVVQHTVTRKAAGVRQGDSRGAVLAIVSGRSLEARNLRGIGLAAMASCRIVVGTPANGGT